MVNCDCCSRTRIVWLMLFTQKIFIEIWQRMLKLTMSSVSTPSSIPSSAMNRKALGFFKEELNSVPMQQFVGMRPKCYAFLCTGKVSNNLLQHTNPVVKKTAKGVKRWMKAAHLPFAHYVDAPNNFHTFLSTEPDQVLPAHCAHSSHV